jgi:hypothetical protein
MASDTPLHPLRACQPKNAKQSFEKFGSHLQKALQDAFPTTAKPYAKVHAELCYFDNVVDEKDSGVMEDVKVIGDLFRDVYKYDVTEFAIPSTGDYEAKKAFLMRIAQLYAMCETDGLLVIYYCGHGFTRKVAPDNDGDARKEKHIWWR